MIAHSLESAAWVILGEAEAHETQSRTNRKVKTNKKTRKQQTTNKPGQKGIVMLLK